MTSSDTHPEHIAQILWSGNLAGAEKYVLTLARTLKRKKPDLQTTVIFLSKAYELGKTLIAENIDYVELGWASGYDLVGIVKFLANVVKNHYNIIHIHIQTAILIPFLKLIPVPQLVYTEHSSILPRGAFRKWFYKVSIKQYDCILFVSKRQNEEIHNHIKLKIKRSAVVPLGIDLGLYDASYSSNAFRSKLGYAQDTCIIGYVGRFDYFKRVDKVISGVAMLRKQISNIRLLIIGFGRNLPIVRKDVLDNCMSDITDFCILPESLIDLQKCMDFLVHPSEHESLGLSVLEAMALGKVVIINNFESAREIVDNGVDGIIIDNISPASIAANIASLWSDKAAYGNISKNAIMKIRNSYNFDHHVDHLLAQYDQLLHRQQHDL